MEFIKRLIPPSILKFIRPYYHGFFAIAANLYFGRPSEQLTVIGVTGTAGKSTTVQMLSKILNNDAKKTGFITTVSFFDGEKEFVNKHGMSMPGGWLLQKQLKLMVNNGCKYAVVECTSEGLAQNRHLGINFQLAIFTNLSKAHLDAHGGFENYRLAKAKLFKLAKSVLVNSDDENAGYFFSASFGRKFSAGFRGSDLVCEKKYFAQKTQNGFSLEQVAFTVSLPGKFNHYNALMAAAAAKILGVSFLSSQKTIQEFTKIRGRMETVENDLGIKILVDYACEPAAMKAALEAVQEMPHNRIIHVFGSTGGHRDVQKRFEFGKISAQASDIILITNDDVYNSDPEKIAEDIEQGIGQVESKKSKVKSVVRHLDRRYAISEALKMAKKDDIVLITGKGSERFLVLPGNKRVGWNETEVVWEEANKLSPSYWEDVAKHHEASLN